MFKIYLVSYACHAASDNLHPSVSGGTWIEVGTFPEAEVKKVIASVTSEVKGSLGAQSNFVVQVVSVRVK